MYFNIEPYFFANELIDAVDARDLHAELEVKDHFSNWIKGRIELYGFLENQDFVNYSAKSEKVGRGRPRKEYAVTLDMAKELAMVERNERGRQVRRYFIDCEKQLRGQPTTSVALPAPVTPPANPRYIENLKTLCQTVMEAHSLWLTAVQPALQKLDSPVAREFGAQLGVAGAMSSYAINVPGAMFPRLT